MKGKRVTCILLMLMCLVYAHAQDVPAYKTWRNKYVNIGYVFQHVKTADVDLNSKYGFSIDVGKTYFLGREWKQKPLRWGIDATWGDIAFISYKNNFQELDVSMGVGPSLTYLSHMQMQLHGFLHYHPSCSWMFLSDESWIGFNSIVTLGVSLSRKSIGVGLESRFSFCPYVPFAPCNCVPIYEPSFTSGYGLRVFMTVRY